MVVLRLPDGIAQHCRCQIRNRVRRGKVNPVRDAGDEHDEIRIRKSRLVNCTALNDVCFRSKAT